MSTNDNGTVIDGDGNNHNGGGNWLTLALLGCAWTLVFILFIFAILIRRLTKPRVDTVNLTSQPTLFYMLKVKTGAISAEFLSGRKEISLDLISNRNLMVGRVKLPINSKAGSPQTVYVRIGTREPIELGWVRVEHNSYRESVSLENIELRELDGPGKIFRADVNSKIASKPKDPRRQTFPAFVDDASFGVAEFLEPGEDNLSLLDWVFFLFFAINVIMLVSLYVHQHVSYHENYGDAAISGCVSGVIALALTLVLVLIYRLLIKRTMPRNAGFCYAPQVIFFSIGCLVGKFEIVTFFHLRVNINLILLLACALGIVAVVLSALHPVSNGALTYWGVSCVISLVLFLILFIPIVIAIEYCIKVVRSSSLESATSRVESSKADKQDGNEYFEAISKKNGGTPIRSISQYRKHPKPPSSPVKKPSPPPKATQYSPVKKQDSTGSEYFNQINRAGVKSISQYAALKKK